MMILPAIDLIGGQAVRLSQGDYTKRSTYGDPLALARSYADAGARQLHLVDLDAAKSGQSHPETERIVQAIGEQLGLQVELGGGIRTAQDVQRWLSLGVWRCVLGTAAIRDYAFARAMADTWGAQVVIGIDARDGLVATHGWQKTEGVTAQEVAIAMKEMGYQDCVHTDISKDGMLTGANVEASAALARLSGLRVVVSGGVRDIRDIAAALALEDAGISGVIAGKSLVEGTLALDQALQLAADGARLS